MSSYDGDGVLSRLRASQWHILLDCKLKYSLLPRLLCIGVFTDMLTRKGMFCDPKVSRHDGRS